VERRVLGEVKDVPAMTNRLKADLE